LATLVLFAFPILVVASELYGGASKWVPSTSGADKVFDESFSLEKDGTLRVRVDDVDVFIQETSSGGAHVTTYLYGPEEEAQEFWERMKFRAQVSGGRLTVETAGTQWRWRSWNDDYGKVHVATVITVPEGVELDVRTEDGDIVSEKIKGDAELSSQDGDVRLGELVGEEVSVSTEDGDVRIEKIEGDRVSVASSDGDIAVRACAGKRVWIGTSDGDVEVEEIVGENVVVKTSDGDADIAVSGDKIEAHTSDGNLRVALRKAMRADLSAGDGDIVIVVPSDMAAEVNLRGERVRIRGELDIKGEWNSRYVAGTINGGGLLVRAHTGDGTVVLSFADKPETSSNLRSRR